jgi:hypothetical protein
MPDRNVRAALRANHLIEKLAAVEHERWSHWQRHLHEQCTPGADGSLTIPPHLVRQWTAQMNASYTQLTEQEKQSDREQVDRYLPVIVAALEANETP